MRILRRQTSYKESMKSAVAFTALVGVSIMPLCSAAELSIARVWNEEILAAIRIDKPNPPVHARNLFHLDTAMYDCWAAYDNVSVGYLHHERATAADTDAARREAISYAAYRILRVRYAVSVNATKSLAAFDARLKALGYDPAITNTVGDHPAALGNRVAANIIAWGLTDGSNEAGGYQDPSYVNPQPPMIVLFNDGSVSEVPWGTDPNRWQPLAFNAIPFSQNGLVADKIQSYLGVTWLQTTPFSLFRGNPAAPWINVGPPSRLGSATDAEYKAGALQLIRASAELGSDEIVDMSPGRVGDNPLGSDDGTGFPANPVTNKPYESNPVRLGDYTRVVSEFWADGPNSETPPGHWHVIANQVADHPLTVKMIGGTGPVVSDLEWDVKTYFAIGAALHDAACAAWSLKRYYEGVRPITMIRLMATLGQSSNPNLPAYHPSGLPLQPGLVELVTETTAEPGARHENAGPPGTVVVLSWPGEPANRGTEVSPVRWIPGSAWVPYQRKTFVTPAFPGYVSGHSTFSRAAAEVLTGITGSPFFPGGLGKSTAEAGATLTFEHGPTRKTELQWATYYDAADLAGRSRRWGGIHVPEDDYRGRIAGAQAGQSAWQLAQRYFDGSILHVSPQLYLENRGPESRFTCYNTLRGMHYQLEHSPDLVHWTRSGKQVQAADLSLNFTESTPSETRFYRLVCSPASQQIQVAKIGPAR